jgi:sugar phosphate isomerase/epimerase
MNNSLPRRQFLRTVAAGAAAGAGSRVLATNALGATGASAQPRLFPGCCAYSYNKYLSKGPMTMEDFILKVVELGVYGADVTTYYLKSSDPTYLVSLRHLAFKNGLPFSGAAIGTNMCQPDPAKRTQELEKIKKWVDATEWLGASHLRVFGGELPAGATEEQGVQWVAEVMKPACEYAAQKGITLGIEDHHGITSKASTILEILRLVDSPYAGINLDISNFAEDPYTQIEACIPYATHTHIRDVFTETGQSIDLDRVFQMFARAGYKGYMSAEYEGAEDPMTAVPKLVDKIRVLSKKYSSA